MSRISVIFLLLLAGCTKDMPVDTMTQPNHIVMEREEPKISEHHIAATFGVGDDPAVQKAYEQYVKSGKMPSIHRKGFKTLAYDANSHPILACEPLHLCVIQLEAGENINDITLGDSVNWLVSTSLVGTQQNGTYQITIKPVSLQLATDMVVTTTRRTYNIGLVSEAGKSTHVVNFYYPQETLQRAIQNANQFGASEETSDGTSVQASHLNFDYVVEGNASWKPTRIFDDGNKTFIEMPEVARHVDLPILYLEQHNTQQLVNYRYKAPYYIIDSVFQTAVLITGTGRSQDKVVLRNRRFG